MGGKIIKAKMLVAEVRRWPINKYFRDDGVPMSYHEAFEE